MNRKGTALYRMENIRQVYAGRTVLDIPGLSIEEGASVGVTGSNGCGKSTLLRILAFMERPAAGSLFFAGTGGSDPVRDGPVTMLLQEQYLLRRSVFENIAYGLKIRGGVGDVRRKVHDIMNLVGLDPEEYGGRKWYELSGGEARRVSLASRIAINPRVLLLDEPVSNADRESALKIRSAIELIRRERTMTLVISSHDHLWLSGVTDYVIKIHEGKIVGTMHDNLIEGPWERDAGGLWHKRLSPGHSIYVTEPPGPRSLGVLDPANVIIAVKRQSESSARNCLPGTVTSMIGQPGSDTVSVEVESPGPAITCLMTRLSVRKLGLCPGKKVWLVFKATAVRWH